MNVDKKYYIFSDECGSWSNLKDKFYFRSWIKIPEDRYLYLKGLWMQKNLPNLTASSLLKNSSSIVEYVNNEPFEYFFTITKLNEFYERKWGIRDSVSLALSQLESKLIRSYERKIPNKLKVALNQVLFLHVYEKFHIENAIENLCSNNSYYEFSLNKPQFTEDDYLQVFEESKNKFLLKAGISFIRNNQNELGLCFADALCSLLNNVLSTNNKESTDFLKKYILPKGASGKIGIKGINKILYPVNRSYGKDELQKEEKEFLEKLRKIFSG